MFDFDDLLRLWDFHYGTLQRPNENSAPKNLQLIADKICLIRLVAISRRNWTWLSGFARTERSANKIIPELPHRSRKFAAFGEDVVERVDEQVDFFLADDEGRQNFHHIHRVTRDLGQDAMLAQHLGHHH